MIRMPSEPGYRKISRMTLWTSRRILRRSPSNAGDDDRSTTSEEQQPRCCPPGARSRQPRLSGWYARSSAAFTDLVLGVSGTESSEMAELAGIPHSAYQPPAIGDTFLVEGGLCLTRTRVSGQWASNALPSRCHDRGIHDVRNPLERRDRLLRPKRVDTARTFLRRYGASLAILQAEARRPAPTLNSRSRQPRHQFPRSEEITRCVNDFMRCLTETPLPLPPTAER